MNKYNNFYNGNAMRTRNIEKVAKKVIKTIFSRKTSSNFFVKIHDYVRKKMSRFLFRIENSTVFLMMKPVKRIIKIGFIVLLVVIKHLWSFRKKDTDTLFCIEERHDPNLGGHSLRLKK